MKTSYIYILTNSTNKVLYIGVTSNLINRITEHKEGVFEKSFTNRYNIHKLVYFEEFDNILDAIDREKQLKKGSRQKKTELIQTLNPEWNDLYIDF